MSKTACVTGAARGLGLSLTKELLHRGYDVYAAGLHTARSEGLKRLTEAYPDTIHPIELNIADKASVCATAAVIETRTGKLDVLINNAAILGPRDDHILGQVDYEAISEVFNVNVLGTLRVTQQLMPLLLQGTDKLVMNISSEAGSIGQCSREGWFAYCMSKSALNMQSHLVHNGIRSSGGQVIIVHPGHVRTYMRGVLDKNAPLTPDESAQHIIRLLDRYPEFQGEAPAYINYLGESLPW